MRLLYSRHLEHFLAVCQARSLRKAAQGCGVTQPALSKSIRVLETALSVSLLERRPAGVVPTPAGEILRRHAVHIVDSARCVEAELGALLGGDGGVLRIGAGMVWSVTHLPQWLARLHARFPRLQIATRSGVSEQLVPLLLDGELDVLVASLSREPLPPGFRTVRLPDADMLAYGRRGHPLTRRRGVVLADLRSCDFVGFADDPQWHRHAEAAFAAAGLDPPRMLLSSSSLETLLATVATSDSLAILPAALGDRAAAAGLAPLRLPAPVWRIGMGISHREHSAELAPLRELVAMACEPARAGLRPPGARGSVRVQRGR